MKKVLTLLLTYFFFFIMLQISCKAHWSKQVEIEESSNFLQHLATFSILQIVCHCSNEHPVVLLQPCCHDFSGKRLLMMLQNHNILVGYFFIISLFCYFTILLFHGIPLAQRKVLFIKKNMLCAVKVLGSLHGREGALLTQSKVEEGQQFCGWISPAN